ncbi:MAG: DUF5752 family protein [Campylobacterales bacterium]|nr:DUF5752 family protein [Campylobacterales bacterium]
MGIFYIKDCALIALSTQHSAQTLPELSSKLLEIESSSIYYHFWATLLRPQFDNPDFQNDFAAWAHYALHDGILAERLSAIDPSKFTDINKLRSVLIDVINERIDESETLLYAKSGQKFFFVKSHIVVFDTQKKCENISKLYDALPAMSLGSIFYHFIDSKRRLAGGGDDFSAWLQENGYEIVANSIRNIDPYFMSLSKIKEKLLSIIAEAKEEEQKNA